MDTLPRAPRTRSKITAAHRTAILCLLFTAVPSEANAALRPQAPSFRPAGVIEFKSAPSHTPARHAVDGPLLGNGDMKVVLSGAPEDQRFFLGKNDLWRLQHGAGNARPVPLGELVLEIPALRGADYHVRQPLAHPHTEAVFERDGLVVQQTALVAADRNLLWIRLESTGGNAEVRAVLSAFTGSGAETAASFRDSVLYARRSFPVDRVDIASGAEVAAKILGAKVTAAAPKAAPPATTTHRVVIGREQHGGGRWGFDGRIDELAIYGEALSTKEIAAVGSGTHDGEPRFHWSFDDEAATTRGAKSAPGRRGRALELGGGSDCGIEVGKLDVPLRPVTVAAWIRIAAATPKAKYVLSCGEWNTGVSLGLSAGKLRFAVNGKFVQSAPLPTGTWVHIAGVATGEVLRVFVDGQLANEAGAVPATAACSFRLEPGRPVDLLLAMDSGDNAREALADVESDDLPAVRRAHESWWSRYWARSWIAIGDPELELAYYRSLGAMAACSRDPDFPPGIFGWDTTDRPNWEGDYHLNYNHFAPFYALYSANRLEQADPQDAPMLAFVDRGRWYAQQVTKTRGVLFPVGIGPVGIETTRDHPRFRRPNAEKGGLFWQQRSNAAYSLVNIAQRWRCTYDRAYGRRVYPLVRDVADFWEDYLVFEGDRYVVLRDAIHEGSGRDKNPILSLGLVRNAIDLALDLSRALAIDEQRHAKWRHILRHLSTWTSHEIEGQKVFRYSEKGTAWWRNNTLGIQHIYPGNALGLDSDPKWLAVAHNTIAVMNRWQDGNGSNSFFPAAVRVGWDPQQILGELRRYAANTYPNGFRRGNPHGIENLSTVPNTLQEMLCSGHVPVGDPDRPESLLRVFPVWPRDRDARFTRIRTWGAFLVSAALEDGTVQQVEIASEQGRPCTIVNPWPGRRVIATGARGKQDLDGTRLEVRIDAGQTTVLKPSGR